MQITNINTLLFNLYVHDLIECLDRKGLGCHMGNHFSGCFIYADDITLVRYMQENMILHSTQIKLN